MRFAISTLSALTFGLIAITANADVGVLDRYDCHNHQKTGEYHCHGTVEKAKRGGVILGADTRVQAWASSNGLFMFAGLAATAEYNRDDLAITASYFFMPLLANGAEGYDSNDSIYLSGWEAGIKAGPGVGRLGSKVYGLAGWSFADLTSTSDATPSGSINGYYIGAGFGVNSDTITLDLAATYRDNSDVVDYLTESLGENTGALVFDIRGSLGWRF